MSRYKLFEDDEDKFYVEFEIRGHGRTSRFSAEYGEWTPWHEILDDVVKTLESSYGYSFNLPDEIGIHYPGKQDDSE